LSNCKISKEITFFTTPSNNSSCSNAFSVQQSFPETHPNYSKYETEDNNQQNHHHTFLNEQPDLLSFDNLPLDNNGSSLSQTSTNKILLKGELFQNQTLFITDQGLINSIRDKKDGQCFFGVCNSKDYSGYYYNDYIFSALILSQFNISYQNNSTGRIFNISYSKVKKCYNINMISNELLLYYYIEDTFYFEKDKGYFLILGKVLLTVVMGSKELGKKYLLIRVEFNDSDDVHDYVYSKEDMPVSIGRKNCVLNIEHCSLSKKHGELFYSDELSMFYYKDNESTNGSIFLFQERDSIRIKGEMKMKLNEIGFQLLELP
jgi:hypothetical protein